MGLLPSSIRMFIHLHKHYHFKGPVLTLGVQDIWATYPDLKLYCKDTPVIQPEILPHNSKMFKQDPILIELSKNFVHAKTFFEMLNICGYFDMDKFDAPHYLHDLNSPVSKELHDSFSLILDGGTVEHIFDMRQIMENITNMLKLNGCVVHIGSFNMDHGFYAISPCFFFEFYTLNGFSDLLCYIIQIDGNNIIKNYPRQNICFKYTYGMDLKKLIDPEKMVLIFFSARKDKIVPFKIPTQGIFDPNKQQISKTNASKNVFMFRSIIPVTLQPVFQPLYPIMSIIKNYINKYKTKKQLI